MDYKSKYLKYKSKYFGLKNIIKRKKDINETGKANDPDEIGKENVADKTGNGSDKNVFDHAHTFFDKVSKDKNNSKRKLSTFIPKGVIDEDDPLHHIVNNLTVGQAGFIAKKATQHRDKLLNVLERVSEHHGDTEGTKNIRNVRNFMRKLEGKP